MELDVKKTNPNPKDKWEAVDLLIKTQNYLIDS